MSKSFESAAAPATLAVSRSLLETVVEHLASALPNEGVGLIAARNESPQAMAYFPGTNVDHSPTRYTMEPAEVLAALREIRTNGWRLGAIAHSHVGSEPSPSATDLREAYYPDALMLIVGFATGVADVRLWQTVPDQSGMRAKPARLEVVPD